MDQLSRAEAAFPRSADRGLIEAVTPISLASCKLLNFRDQLIAASLKRGGQSIPGARVIYFRDQLIAASLKQQAARDVIRRGLRISAIS